MKSIRTRLVASFLGTILILFLILALIGVYYQISSIELHSSESMKLLSEEKTGELNKYFSGVERAVDVLEEYIKNNVDMHEYRINSTYREEFYGELKENAVNAARVLGNVESVYFRPDPTRYGGTAGFFLNLTNSGDYAELTPTNITNYKEDDTEHVGWYYEPIKKGGPLWMEPYSNENINVYMVSYVTPVYLGREFVGILGMDMDMTLIHEVIDRIDYEKSVGLLMSENGTLLYHRDYPSGLLRTDFPEELQAQDEFFTEACIGTGYNYSYIAGGEKYRIILSRLENGMILSISTPESELFKTRNAMLIRLLVVFFLALAMIIVLSTRMTKRIVEPIEELTNVSSRIAKGELGQEIEYHSKDEIGSLADSIRKISVELKVYIDYIHEQAYLDAMTGVRNKASYLAEESRLESLIRERMASFTVYVFDVNGLKKMNDNYGHEYGDMMIKDSAQVIKAVFKDSYVYRIGGDEFAVIAKHQSENEIKRNFAKFDEMLENFNLENEKYEDDLAISKGAAVYNPETDQEYASVFGRADEDMYHCKAEYYKKHGDRRRS
ncbi:MAG: diguanylate cyclase [Lachnospiraceae bacterium]|nr:diguanylate cyclase [Lachnospiraceae bacterium]